MVSSRVFFKALACVISMALCFSQAGIGMARESVDIPANETIRELESSPGHITIDFKDADIHNVLRILALKSNVNIVAGRDVQGTVTIRLNDVPWYKALDVILKTYDFGYERDGDIIMVSSLEKLTQQKKAAAQLAEVQDVVTEVFDLKYLDANDAKDAVESMLSTRGTISVLKMTGQAGWEFGAGSSEDIKKLERKEKVSQSRSKTLIVTDIPPRMEKIRAMITRLDLEPEQIIIESRIMEVNRDLLTDIGIDWGTGSTGAETSTISAMEMNSKNAKAAGGHILSDQVTSSVFGPEATGLTTANTGLKFLYQRLRGTQFEVVLHALEEDVDTNTLSAPRILTVNNQEATIMVGTKYPILKTETEEGVISTSLDYYQDIGIQLNVVPQVSAKEYINMVVHPAVTEQQSTVGDNRYPVISTREAETRILMKDGETIVIGGLLKDVKKKGVIGVPILKDIPLLGVLFRKETKDSAKIDLLIFITAHIVKPGQYTEEELALLRQGEDAIEEFEKKHGEKKFFKKRKKKRK